MSRLAPRLLRMLLPSWRFFDEIEPAPRLWLRELQEGDPGAWQHVQLVPTRHAGALLFNPRGNLGLAEHALLEQLLSDVAEPEVDSAADVERLESYELVLRVARTHAPRSGGAAGTRFQFKLTLQAANASGSSADEDVLVSRVHEV